MSHHDTTALCNESHHRSLESCKWLVWVHGVYTLICQGDVDVIELSTLKYYVIE